MRSDYKKALRPLFLFMFTLLAAYLPLEAKPEIEVHGFVWCDLQGTSRLNVLNFGWPWPYAVEMPLDCDSVHHHPKFSLDARVSRLYVTAKDKICNWEVFAKVEGDFFRDNATATSLNSRDFRLRHAYADIISPCGWYLRFGQYWSLATNYDIGYPPKFVDFNGPEGSFLVRQPMLQIGYIKKLGKDKGELLFAVSMEKQAIYPGLAKYTYPVAIEQGNGMTVPLFVGKVGWYKYNPLQMEWAVYGTENRVTLPGKPCPPKLHCTKEECCELDSSHLANQPHRSTKSICKQSGGCGKDKSRCTDSSIAKHKKAEKEIKKSCEEKCYNENEFCNRGSRQIGKGAWGTEFAFQRNWCNFSIYGEANYSYGLNRLSYEDYPDIAISLEFPGLFHNVRSAGGYLGVSWSNNLGCSMLRCRDLRNGKSGEKKNGTGIGQDGSSSEDELPQAEVQPDDPKDKYDTVFYAIGGFHWAKPIDDTTFSKYATKDDVIYTPWQHIDSFQVGAVHTFFKNFDVGFEYKHWWLQAVNERKGSFDQYTANFVYYF